MLYQVLLGTVTYCAGAGALSWWLGGIFKRERAALGLTVEQLRESQEWIAAHRAPDVEDVVDVVDDASVLAEVMAAQDLAQRGDPARRYTA